jgi:hypothetical protein
MLRMIPLYQLVLMPEAPQMFFLATAEARLVLRLKRQVPQADMEWSRQSVRFLQSRNAA